MDLKIPIHNWQETQSVFIQVLQQLMISADWWLHTYRPVKSKANFFWHFEFHIKASYFRRNSFVIQAEALAAWLKLQLVRTYN